MPDISSVEQLALGLQSEAALEALLEARGWSLDPEPVPLPARAVLAGARLFHAPSHDAPRLLVLYRTDMSGRAVHGNELRRIQAEANRYKRVIESEGAVERSPALCVVASPAFLVLFELNGNPFARRRRFTEERLRASSQLEESFRSFTAASLAARARTLAADDPLAEILGKVGRRTWDFETLVSGGALDEEFVEFMSHARRRIAMLLLDTAPGRRLLKNIWPKLCAAAQVDDADRSMPTLEHLVRDPHWRRVLIAVVDSVLLRLILYRYLEAQFGYRTGDDEQRGIAFGSYDELLQATTRFDEEKLDKLLKRIHADDTGISFSSQMDLFQVPVDVTKEKAFRQGLQQRADYYGQIAGGDLHNGAIAEAADELQAFLIREHAGELALLLEETRTDRYSFHYADLDPRAFGEFYQSTIGTDIRAQYDPGSEEVRIRVVDFERNQKEHGAYYTREKLSGWLIDRSLGRLYESWKTRLVAVVDRPNPPLGDVRTLLEELLGWRILDPTVGSGVFLRGAFEYLSRRFEEIARLLRDSLSRGAWEELVVREPFDLFRERSIEQAGDWEWHILLHMLYGIDVDVKAVNVASNLLTLSALSYKRHGVCFPSFINTSLKRGNSLVPILRPEDREEFVRQCSSEIRKLLKLRAQLRDSSLGRGQWAALHRQAATISRNLLQGYIIKKFRGAFPGMKDQALIARVLRVGVFFYEMEFPEVYFTHEGTLRPDAGFDVIIGNPPWEEPAAELKKFLPEFDPEYLELAGPKAKAREERLLRDKEIARQWDERQRFIEDFKALLVSGWYQHQRRQVRERIPGAHTNLYKYATELAWTQLRGDGIAGLVLDGGLWGDLASSGLRAMLLDRSSTEAVCGFINYDEIFPDIDNRMKFGANVFRRGGRTETLRAVFMRQDIADLDRFDSLAVPMEVAVIRQDPRDSYPVPEVRNEQHYKIERRLTQFGPLDAPPWSVETYSREFNAGEQRDLFLEKARGRYPLVQGEQFNLFGVHQGEPPTQWVDPSDDGAGGFLRDKQRKRVFDAVAEHIAGKPGQRVSRKHALEWIRRRTGRQNTPAEWVRLDWEGYRLAWRDVTNATNQRTLIAAIIPPRVALSHKAPYVRPFRLSVDEDGVRYELQYPHEVLLYLAGVCSSFALDAVSRPRIPKTTFSSETFQSLPVPPWTGTRAQRQVAILAARLTCLPSNDQYPWADYADLAASVGLRPKRDGLIEPAERLEAEIELNALVAGIYGLGRSDFRFLMDLLFMTPEHREKHARLRDDIAARLREPSVGD